MPLADFRLKKLAVLPESISQLAELARAEGFRFVDRLIADFQTGNNTFSDVGEIFIGVFDDGQLIGFGGLNQDPHSQQSTVGRVRRLYVHPQYRGCGVGQAILKRIEQEASDNFIRLNLFTDSVEAARFYEKLGYTAIDSAKVSHFKCVLA